MKHLFLIVLLFALSSCEDNRRQNLVPDKIYLVRTGLNTEESFDIGEKYVSNVWANKSGLNGSTCKVSFAVDVAALNAYNAETGSTFEMLPSSCYTLSKSDFVIEGDEQYAKFGFEYDPAVIVAEWEKMHGNDTDFSKYGMTDFVLPLSITSEGVETVEEARASLIRFAVNEPLISIQTNSFDMVRIFEGETGVIEKTVEIGTAFDNRWDCNVTLETDRAALKELVAKAKGTVRYSETRLKSKTAGDVEEFSSVLTHIDGVLPPDNACTINGNLNMKASTNRMTLTVAIDKTKLHPGLNIFPVALKNVTDPLKVNPLRNVCYIPVQYVPTRDAAMIKSSSSHQSADYAPKRVAGLFDGDFDNSWRPGVGSTSFPSGIANDNSPAIVVDIGKTSDITAVELWTRGPGERQGSRTETYRAAPTYIRNVKIYVSNDTQCWEADNGEFLIKGTALITNAKPYWGEALIDYNWEADNPISAPHTFNLPVGTTGRYVAVWFTKSANQADLWELFVYDKRD
ncbi:MAG: DUF1735 domain-containing protein [Tannerella sp.]|nr:DUF1735 domain-containing protein [Tannerella sp.]